MRVKASLIILIALASIMPTPIARPVRAYSQTTEQALDRMFEPMVARLSEVLKLKAEQIAALRQILSSHAPRIRELRERARSQPFSPRLQMEVEQEQRAIREEFAAHLTEDQKARLAGVDARLPVPIAPPFILVNIQPRSRTDSEQASQSSLATRERLIAAPQQSSSRQLKLNDDQKLLHLLNRATFGPRPGDLERVRQLGAERFLNEQLRPENIDDAELEKRLAALPTLQLTSPELYQFYPPPNQVDERAKQNNAPPIYGRPQQIIGELVQSKLVRAASSTRQLQEVMTDFWFNHFNVFAQKEADLWMVTGYERDAIRPHALGRFHDLLLAVAQSPAMLYYLDNWLSSSNDARPPRPTNPFRQAPGASSAPSQRGANTQSRRRGVNENYARELLELHTVGVAGGYTQKDVQEVARAFTGWTIDRPFQGGGFVFRPWMHDTGSKTLLGVTLPAGGGISDGKRVIEILARHPSTARFISRKLCQRFVSDKPVPQMVERVAQVFLRTDGDISEVLRAIFTSAEFYSASAFRSKVKSPLELAASAIRAIDADTNGAPALHEWLRRMGEPLYLNQAPTGYGEDSTVWINTGVFFNRINFAVALANNQIVGTKYDAGRLVSADTAANEDALMNNLSALIVHTELSAESRRAVQAGLAPKTESQPVTNLDLARAGVIATRPEIVPVGSRPALDVAAARRVAQVIGLLLGTTEFQRK